MTGYLTSRQKAILEFIEAFQEREGVAPTHREICERFGFSSYGTAHKHLRLLAEKGFVRRAPHQRRGMELLAPPSPSRSSGTRQLPFLGRIAAGAPIEALPVPETVVVPPQLLGGRRREHFVLRVSGSSMVDEGIHDGDWVVVERRETAEPGESVVALLGEEVTLKRYFPEPSGLVRLQPANAALAPLIVSAADLRIQGVVVGLMRRF